MKIFKNASITDFTLASERVRFSKALEDINQRIQNKQLRSAPIIEGVELTTSHIVTRKDPSQSNINLGVIYYADVSHALSAIVALEKYQATWQATPLEDRAKALEKLAELISLERANLAALIIREGGKTWREADGDVLEAIDFCNYYALQARKKLTPHKCVDLPGEDNFYIYQPRGVAAVIAPWNFPLAILCGMTVAALVCGNSVVIKPAEQSSLIAFEFAQFLLKAGIPPQAFAFLPGVGEEVGRTLVKDPKVAIIAFTGSKNVGVEILKTTAEILPGQRLFKKCILELGGKNTIIVDQDADLDEAIKGILYSAFGYAGQKCSACSRVIAVGDVYETFLKRLHLAAKALTIGVASHSSSYLGPVIDEEAQKRILNLIKRHQGESHLLFQGDQPDSGYYVPITIFRDVKIDSPLWREEIFGPILAIRQAENFEDAINLAIDSEYGLTGGLYSRHPDHITYAKKHFLVGNLYINRGCTGAIVERQPFGGLRLSGLGGKAGGHDYLLHFVEARVTSENTMRRGFTPESK